MSQYRELKVYKEFGRKYDSLIVYLQRYDQDLYEKALTWGAWVDSLKAQLEIYYRKNDFGEYRRLRSKDIADIKDSYTNILAMLTGLKNEFLERYPGSKGIKYFNDLERMISNDKSITDMLSDKDNLSLPAAVYKLDKEIKKNDYVNGNFKWPGFDEYSRIYDADKTRTKSDILDEFIKKTPQEVERTYKRTVDSTPHLYEYYDTDKVIPPEIRNTSDVAKINKFLADNNDKLSYPLQVKLKKQIETSNKVREINAAAETAMNNNQEIGAKPAVISNGPEHAELRLRMPAHQSSSNGCWSCAAQMLIASRGINNVTQEDVRNYRPKLTDGELILDNDQTDYAYNNPAEKNLLEMGDNVLSFAPNSMLHECSIGKYTPSAEKKGIAREKYINDTVAFMKQQILHAIKVDHSPVTLLSSEHYISITGINGDIISYKDSKGDKGHGPNHTYKISLKEILKEEYNKKVNDEKSQGQIQLSWISDVKLSQDGKTLYGVPSVYAGVNEDGTVILPPDEIGQFAADELLQFGKKENGARIYRLAGDERSHIEHNYDAYKNKGVDYVEKVYMPKKLNVAYLKNRAAGRSAEEEQMLKNANKVLFNIPDDKEAAKQAIDNVRNKIEPAVKNNDNEMPLMGMELPVNNVEEKVSLLSIRDMSRRLYDNLNRHEHFYILHKKESYTSLLDNLSEVTRLAAFGARSAVNKDDNFKPADLKSMVNALDNAIRCAKRYLNQKMEEFKADPRRKNDPGKQKLEQSRIKEVLASYETMLKYRDAIDETFYQKKPEKDLKESRNEQIAYYKSKLVSEYKYDKSLHERSYHNSIDIPEKLQRPLERMEAIWGRNPELLSEFEDENYFEKITELDPKTSKEKKVSTFRKIKSMDSDMIGIGPGGKNDMLTNKDFAALACAASTMRSVFDIKDGSSFRYPNVVTLDTEYICYGIKAAEESTGLTMTHNMTKYVEMINLSKDMVKDAMSQYKSGNLVPLAKIIREGITNFTRASRADLFDTQDGHLYLGEMCERMLSMMNRDNKLMNEVMKQGLSAADVDYIDTMKEIGLKSCQAVDYMNQCLGVCEYAQNPVREWSPEEKLEYYTDMMVSELYSGVKKEILEETTENPEYLREYRELENVCCAEEGRFRKKLIDKFTKTLAGEKEADKLIKDYHNKITAANAMENDAQKESAIENAEKDFVTDIEIYIDRFAGYSNKLLEKYKVQLDDMDAERASSQKSPLNKKEKISECLKLEKAYVNRLKVAVNDEEKATYDRERSDLVRYEKYAKKLPESAAMLTELRGRKGDLVLRRLQYQSVLTCKYVPEINLLYHITRPPHREDIRQRVKNYIVGNGFDKYSMKDFTHKLFMNNAPQSIRRGKTFSSVLAQWEQKQKKKKQPKNELPKKKQPNKEQPENAPGKVRENDNRRKGSVVVKGNKTGEDINNGKRSNSMAVKGKAPGI